MTSSQRGLGEPLSGIPAIERTLTIGPDLELRVKAVIDPASVGDSPQIDIRLFHRSGREWLPGHQGMEVPVRLAAAAADAIRHVAARAAQLMAMAPPTRA